MNKAEFLEGLNAALAGEIDGREHQNVINYYSDYIDSKMREGISEEEVISSLGNPRLIAKSILQTKGTKTTYDKTIHDRMSQETYENKAYRTEFDLGKGFKAGMNEEGQMEFRYKKLNFNSWYGKLILILLAIILIALVIGVCFGVLYLTFTFLLPLVLIAVMVYVIFRILGK